MGIMALSVTSGGSSSSIDMEANGVSIKSVLHSYSNASRLDFTMIANEASTPIARYAYVHLTDDGTVVFVGHVISISPGSHANEVRVVCMDPTYLAAKTVWVMSLPYTTGGVVDPHSVPRLVYNCKNPADDDYAYSVAQNSTVGTIVGGLLDFTVEALKMIKASSTGGAVYNSADFTDMNFVPQNKIVWETITIRAALEQVWRLDPRFRLFFDPATGLWRFFKLSASTAQTVYVNNTGKVSTGGAANPCIGLEITPCYEDVYTAVSIFGPPTIGTATFISTYDATSGTVTGDLTPLGSPIFLETYSDSLGTHNAQFWGKWRIADSTKRKGARMLADWTAVPVDKYSSLPTRYPTVWLSWDGGTAWTAAKGVQFDYLAGTITFLNNIIPYTVITNDLGQSIIPGTTQTMFPPNAIKLTWAPYLDPLEVRYPSSGYSGSAYSTYGIETEMRMYDEGLAIGREYGVPVTSTFRESQYTDLAKAYHDHRSDMVFSGSVVLAGIDYSWLGMNKLLNVADSAGSTTGWEAMNAVVTDVEYTYGDNPSTALTINSNYLELYGEDPAQMRERLRISSTQAYSWSQIHGVPIITNTFRTEQGYFGNSFPVLESTTIYDPNVYIDQWGRQQLANIRGGQ